MQPLPSTSTALPLFPLPDYYLFPGVVAPLHIFETRYRQMVADLMDGPGRFVLTSYSPGGPRGRYGPDTLHIGTLTEILRHDKLDDGRYVMLVAALTRVEIQEAESVRLYRRVETEIIDDSDTGERAATILRPRLKEALEERASGEWEATAEVTVGRLADLLLHALVLDPVRASRAYLETDPYSRAHLALAWHRDAPTASADGAGLADEAEG